MLKPDYRMVIVLKHYHDFSYQEMADVLGVPEKTVKSRLFTARQQLKDILTAKGSRNDRTAGHRAHESRHRRRGDAAAARGPRGGTVRPAGKPGFYDALAHVVAKLDADPMAEPPQLEPRILEALQGIDLHRPTALAPTRRRFSPSGRCGRGPRSDWVWRPEC
jgi:hypothetical protein